MICRTALPIHFVSLYLLTIFILSVGDLSAQTGPELSLQGGPHFWVKKDQTPLVYAPSSLNESTGVSTAVGINWSVGDHEEFLFHYEPGFYLRYSSISFSTRYPATIMPSTYGIESHQSNGLIFSFTQGLAVGYKVKFDLGISLGYSRDLSEGSSVFHNGFVIGAYSGGRIRLSQRWLIGLRGNIYSFSSESYDYDANLLIAFRLAKQ